MYRCIITYYNKTLCNTYISLSLSLAILGTKLTSLAQRAAELHHFRVAPVNLGGILYSVVSYRIV